MKNYQECYKIYCEAKRDIKEEPLAYGDWFILEKEAEKEWEDS